jgi:hypothetical protein
MVSPSIGFIIVSHNFNKKQPLILRLLDRLEQFNNAYTVIHHDFSKTAFPDEEIKKYKACFVQPHIVTSWATWPVVIATLQAMRTLVERKPDVEWFVLLSANDYPVKSVEYIERFFANAEHDAYIQQTLISKETYLKNKPLNNFIKYSYLKLFSYHLKVPFLSRKGKFYKKSLYLPKPSSRQMFNDKFKCLTGEQWFMGNRKVLDYFVNNAHENSAFGKFCAADRICPDNLFFHALIGNNKEFLVTPEIYRYIDWSKTTNWHPNTLTLDDYQRIDQSNSLFGRKVDFIQSAELLDLIDQVKFNITPHAKMAGIN